ncbi:hypothetical protein [Stenotrophomonas sp. Iso1]|nr:hypothetical protein [Stenotrophomonas sp. Iso1]
MPFLLKSGAANQPSPIHDWTPHALHVEGREVSEAALSPFSEV